MTANGMTISPDRSVHIATTSDLPYVDHLQKLWRDDIGWIPMSRLRLYVDRTQLLIAKHRGQHAGYLDWCCNRKGLLTILQLAIDQELWRSGLGSMIMHHLQHAAQNAHCSALRLYSHEHLDAQYLWQNLGFTRTAILAPKNQRNRLIHEWTKPLPLQANTTTSTKSRTSINPQEQLRIINPHSPNIDSSIINTLHNTQPTTKQLLLFP